MTSRPLCGDDCQGTLEGSLHFDHYILVCTSHPGEPSDEDVSYILEALIKAVENRGFHLIGSVHKSGAGDEVACEACDRHYRKRG